jgi:general secretion pathway protein G
MRFSCIRELNCPAARLIRRIAKRRTANQVPGAGNSAGAGAEKWPQVAGATLNSAAPRSAAPNNATLNSAAPENHVRKNRSGRLPAFTLIELMVVVVILGILAVFVVPRVSKRPEDARVTKARVEIANLEQALEMYYLDTGTYPTTEQGLNALVQEPSSGGVSGWRDEGYLSKSKVPDDPWGNPYVYVSPGVHNRDYDLYSRGKDGVEGGEGYDADITNWE